MEGFEDQVKTILRPTVLNEVEDLHRYYILIVAIARFLNP